MTEILTSEISYIALPRWQQAVFYQTYSCSFAATPPGQAPIRLSALEIFVSEYVKLRSSKAGVDEEIFI